MSTTLKNPQVGDTVYVAGHGPGKLVESKVRGKKKYKVEYPNGGTVHVSLDQILECEATPNLTSPGSPAESFSGRRSPPMSPRRIPVNCTGPRGLEYLGRAFDDDARTTHSPAAVFSLVATMTGGGVLSLPYAMSQCGLVVGISVLLLSGAASFWSFNMLVESARLTGRDTFELVGHAAFGERGRKLTMFLVFIICWLASVGYYVLLGDLLVPILMQIFPAVEVSNEVWRIYTLCGATVVLAPMCFKGSLSALRYLCFLSATSVLIVAIVIAIRAWDDPGQEHDVVIQYNGVNGHKVLVSGNIDIWPRDGWMALYSIPTFAVSFMCQFNALPTHQELVRPTAFRIRRVSALSMVLTTFIYLFVAVSGYVYAETCTCGNILLNFRSEDVAAVIARAALACVVMLNMPLLVQPARNSLFRLLSGTKCCGETPAVDPTALNSFAPTEAENISMVDHNDVVVLSEKPEPLSLSAADHSQATAADGAGPSMSQTDGTIHVVVNTNGNSSSSSASANQLPQTTGCDRQASRTSATSSSAAAVVDPPAAVLVAPSADRSRSPSPGSRDSASSDVARVHVYRRQDTHHQRDHREGLEAMDSFLPKDDTVLASAVQPTVLQRSVVTALIIVTSLGLALGLKSVMVVWSVLGSTVCFLVGFILPSAFWCKIVGPHVKSLRYVGAVGLLCLSALLSVICTILTFQRLSLPPCPDPPQHHPA